MSSVKNRNNKTKPQKVESVATTAKSAGNAASPMYAERLKKLYAAMVKCRMLEKAIAALERECGIEPQHEAVLAGAGIHIQAGDLLAPSFASCSGELLQGKALDAIFAGLQNPNTNQPGLKSSPGTTSSAMSVAAGMALAAKLASKANMTLSIVHDESGATDFWREPVQFAVAHQLPIVFVISRGTNSSASGSELRSQAQHLLPAITLDGNDVVAVYRVAEETTRRARQGLGPSLMECWIDPQRDPLQFMEAYLKKRNLWSDDWKADLVREFAHELDAVGKKHARSRRKSAHH